MTPWQFGVGVLRRLWDPRRPQMGGGTVVSDGRELDVRDPGSVLPYPRVYEDPLITVRSPSGSPDLTDRTCLRNSGFVGVVCRRVTFGGSRRPLRVLSRVSFDSASTTGSSERAERRRLSWVCGLRRGRLLVLRPVRGEEGERVSLRVSRRGSSEEGGSGLDRGWIDP